METNAIKIKSFAYALRIVKLYQSTYLDDKCYTSIAADTKSLLKLLTSIIKTSKNNHVK